MELLKLTLLSITRGGLLLLPLLPLLSGGMDLPPPSTAYLFNVFPNMFFPDIAPKNFVFRAVVEVVFGAWVVLAVVDSRYRLKFNGPFRALVCFLAVLTLAAVFGVNPQQSIWSNYERMQGLVGHLHLVAFFVVAATVFNSERWWTRFFHVSLAVALIVSVFALCQYLRNSLLIEFPKGLECLYRMHNQREFVGVDFRADARLGSPVFLAIYALFHVFLALVYLFRTRSMVSRIGYLAAAMFFTFTLYNCGTRSALYGVVAGLTLALLLVGLLDSRRSIRRLSVGLVAVLVAIALIPFVLLAVDPTLAHDNPFLQRFSKLGVSFGGRTLVWGTAFQGFLERPLLGWGQENFQYVFDKHFDPGLVFFEQWYDHPHNVFVGWLVAAGVFGLAAYVWVFAMPFWMLWRRPSSALTLTLLDRSLLSGMLVGYVTYNVWMFDNLLTHLLFLSVTGYLHSVTSPPPPPPSAVTPRARPVLVAAVAAVSLSAVCVALYQVNWKPMRVGIALADALNNPEKVVDGVTRLKMEDVVQMDTFAGREVSEQSAQLAMNLVSQPRVSKELKHRAVEVALEALAPEGKHGRARTQLWMGMLLRSIDRYAEASEYFERASRLAPNRQLMLIEMGRSYMLEKRVSEGIGAFRTAWEKEPKYRSAAVLLAVAACENNSEMILREVVEKLHPSEGPLLRRPDPMLTRSLFRKRRFDLLIPIYQRLVDRADEAWAREEVPWIVPRMIDSYVALAVALAASGEKEAGLNQIRAAIALDSRFRDKGWQVMDSIRNGKPIDYPQDGWKPPATEPKN